MNLIFKKHVKPNPKNYIKADNFQYEGGDREVLSTSQLVPALKWAHEFDNGKKGSAPVKFVHYCSGYKKGDQLWDGVDTNSMGVFEKNGYMGIGCRCLMKKDQTDCDHNQMMSDPHLVKFLVEVLVDGQTKQGVNEVVEMIDNDFLSDFVRRCKLERGSFLRREDRNIDMMLKID